MFHKNKTIITLIFFCFVCMSNAQEKEIYRKIEFNLKKIEFEIDLTYKDSIQEKSIMTDSVESYKIYLNHTTYPNYFYYNVKSITKETPYIILKFENDGLIMALYLDDFFTDKNEVENFLKNNVQLDKKTPFYFIKNISLDDINLFPSYKEITSENVEKLKIELRGSQFYFKEKDLNAKQTMFYKKMKWLEVRLLTLGYKPFENQFEFNDFINILN